MKFLDVDPKIFDSDEFDSPDSPGSGVRMNLEFMKKLYALRLACNFPFKIHSGIRTQEHNKKVGGVSESEHTEGLGADIEITSSVDRFFLVSKAIEHGFRRIGIGKSFVHLGLSKELDQFVMWTYYK